MWKSRYVFILNIIKSRNVNKGPVQDESIYGFLCIILLCDSVASQNLRNLTVLR